MAKPRAPLLEPTHRETVTSYGEDAKNALDAEIAIEAAAYGDFTNLIYRLRGRLPGQPDENLPKLTIEERELLAKILELTDKRKGPKGRPSSLIKRGEATRMAVMVACGEAPGMTEAAVAGAQQHFKVSRSKIFEAINETEKRNPAFAKARQRRINPNTAEGWSRDVTEDIAREMLDLAHRKALLHPPISLYRNCSPLSRSMPSYSSSKKESAGRDMVLKRPHGDK